MSPSTCHPAVFRLEVSKSFAWRMATPHSRSRPAQSLFVRGDSPSSSRPPRTHVRTPATAGSRNASRSGPGKTSQGRGGGNAANLFSDEQRLAAPHKLFGIPVVAYPLSVPDIEFRRQQRASGKKPRRLCTRLAPLPHKKTPRVAPPDGTGFGQYAGAGTRGDNLRK
jgi:hypothetical protein